MVSLFIWMIPAHDMTASILLPVQQQPGDPEHTSSEELYLS